MSFVTMMEGHLAWGDKPLLDNADLTVEAGQRIGLIGRNGTGKSSLLKVLAGIEKLDGGELHTQNGLHAVYVEQEPYFPEAPTVMDSLVLRGKLDELPDEKMRWQIQSRLSEFLHKFDLDENLDLKKASGGEKKKAALALAFALDADLLLLDEPTNHMDLAGKEALEKMLTSYEGTVLFVSHDRYFINQVATGILEFGESDVQFYGMNYAQYLEEIKRQTPGRETGNAGGTVRKSADVPTLDDVFDKKKYYNPGKILSRLKRQLEKYEEQLAESESRMSELQLEMMDPELSADYERLMELQTKIDEENQTQESLLERMMETELELEEMETQDE